MEELENKKELLMAIREAIANIRLEEDSLFNSNEITEDEIEEIYKKLVMKCGRI